MNNKSLLVQRLVHGGTWSLVGKIITSVAGLAISIILAKILSPSDFGIYFILQTLVSVSVIIITLGFDKGIVKFLSEALAKDDYYKIRIDFTGTLKILIISSIIFISLLQLFGIKLISSIMNIPFIHQISFLVYIWILLAAFQRIITETFRGLHKINLATLYGGSIRGGIVYYLLFICLITIYTYTSKKYTLQIVISLTIISVAFSLIVSGIVLSKQYVFQKGKKNNSKKYDLRKNISTVMPLYFSSIVLFLLNRGDIWLLGIFKSNEDVALYGAAAKLLVIINSSLIIINYFLPPIITDLFTRKDNVKLERTLRTTATIAGIPAVITLLILINFPRNILGIIYSEYYTSASTILIILSIGQLTNVFAGSCGITLMMTGHQISMFKITFLSTIITIILGIALVNKYGTEGVAIAFSSGLILQNFLMLIYVKIKLNVWTHIYLDAFEYITIIKKLKTLLK